MCGASAGVTEQVKQVTRISPVRCGSPVAAHVYDGHQIWKLPLRQLTNCLCVQVFPSSDRHVAAQKDELTSSPSCDKFVLLCAVHG